MVTLISIFIFASKAWACASIPESLLADGSSYEKIIRMRVFTNCGFVLSGLPEREFVAGAEANKKISGA
jgi:hypothetical protein